MDLTITENDCKKVLSTLHTNSETNLKAFNLKVASKDHDGFFGDSHFLTITYGLPNQELEKSFFVKIYPKNPNNAEMAKNLLAYEKEVFFYKIMVPKLEKIGLKTDYVPRCYFLKQEKIIVLENLLERNYRNRFAFTLDEMKCGLVSIAKMHSGSILLEELGRKIDPNFTLDGKYPEVFEERFFDLQNPKSFVFNHFVQGQNCIEKLVENYFPQLKDFQEEFLERLKKINFQKVFDEDLHSRKVCCHGDLWRRNILFQENTNYCKLVDFQMLKYYYPAFDILSYVYFNFDPKLFKIYRTSLLKYYFMCLGDTLGSNGYQIENILTFEDFMKTVNHFEVLAIYQALVGHTLDIENVEVVGDMFFGDRLKYCLMEFEQNKKYRDALTDDILCLFEHVMKIKL